MNAQRRIAAAGAVALLVCGHIAAKDSSAQTVRIDHRTGTISPAGPIGLAKGDDLIIALENTYPVCYRYKVEDVQPAQPKSGGFAAETVLFKVRHDGKATAYRIKADLRAGADPLCPLSSDSWEIPVEAHEWSLALTGAFTIDGLKDPIFFLEPTTRPGSAGQPAEDGFNALQDSEGEDDFTLGLASMIHLFHSNDAYLRVLADEVSWSPISFGISVAGEGNSAKYFVGTSLKVGSKFYITLGYAFGSVHRLPSGVTSTTFLENANALNSLPSRRIGRPFVAFSYSFIDVSPSLFRDRFVEPQPEGEAPGGDSATPSRLWNAAIEPKAGKAGTPVTITLTGGTFTGDPKRDKITVDEKDLEPPPATEAGAKTATIRIPDGSKGELSILVEIDRVASDPLKFVVEAPAPPK